MGQVFGRIALLVLTPLLLAGCGGETVYTERAREDMQLSLTQLEKRVHALEDRVKKLEEK